jgi:hypothetical protein
MGMDEAGAEIDLQIEEWKRDLETMRAKADRRPDGAGGPGWAEIEDLRREFQGLRIKKVATWHAPEDRREEARASFDEVWPDWVERAQAAKRALNG